jgi:hypothetical protein
MQGHDDIDCMVYHSAEEAASLNIRRTAFIASEHEWHMRKQGIISSWLNSLVHTNK